MGFRVQGLGFRGLGFSSGLRGRKGKITLRYWPGPTWPALADRHPSKCSFCSAQCASIRQTRELGMPTSSRRSSPKGWMKTDSGGDRQHRHHHHHSSMIRMILPLQFGLRGCSSRARARSSQGCSWARRPDHGVITPGQMNIGQPRDATGHLPGEVGADAGGTDHGPARHPPGARFGPYSGTEAGQVKMLVGTGPSQDRTFPNITDKTQTFGETPMA